MPHHWSGQPGVFQGDEKETPSEHGTGILLHLLVFVLNRRQPSLAYYINGDVTSGQDQGLDFQGQGQDQGL